MHIESQQVFLHADDVGWISVNDKLQKSKVRKSSQTQPRLKSPKMDARSQRHPGTWALDLSSNQLTDEAMALLSLGVRDIANLRSLDISNNTLVTQQGLQVLCAFAFGVHPGVHPVHHAFFFRHCFCMPSSSAFF